MVKQNRDLGRVAVEYCRQRGLMGVLRELAARKERQRAWKKANAHVPPVAPVVGGLSTPATAVVNFEVPDCQPETMAVVEAAFLPKDVAAAYLDAVHPRPLPEIAIVEPAADLPLAEIVPPKPDLAGNLERALATLRAQMEEAT